MPRGTFNYFAETLRALAERHFGFAETLRTLAERHFGFAETLRALAERHFGFAETLRTLTERHFEFAETLHTLAETLWNSRATLRAPRSTELMHSFCDVFLRGLELKLGKKCPKELSLRKKKIWADSGASSLQ